MCARGWKAAPMVAIERVERSLGFSETAGPSGVGGGGDWALAQLAAGQSGVVSRAQLRALGLGRGAIAHRIAAGRLHPLHRGVYAVGHAALAADGRFRAALLACGPTAVLSHRSAAALWGLRPANGAIVEVITADRGRRDGRGIVLRRARTLVPADVASVHGIACTSVARTLLDLAAVLDRRSLERALEQAEVLRLYDGRALAEILGRGRGRRGARLLREVLAEHGSEPTLTRSQMEELFLSLCRQHGLPAPRVNAPVALGRRRTIEVDFLWPARGLVVETDGWGAHGTRAAFDRDRRRDSELLLAGLRVVRFTWRQLTRDASTSVATVRALLASGGPGAAGGAEPVAPRPPRR